MRTYELSSPDATREKLAALVEAGNVLHGTPVCNLSTLLPAETGFHHIDSVTGKTIPPESLVHGTIDVDYAIYMAAAHAPIRDVIRARDLPPDSLISSVLPIYDDNGDFRRREYYANSSSKTYVKEREAAGILGAVCWYPMEGLRYRPRSGDWVTDREVQVIGSYAVAVSCLSFDFYALPEPIENPVIKALVDKVMGEWRG